LIDEVIQPDVNKAEKAAAYWLKSGRWDHQHSTARGTVLTTPQGEGQPEEDQGLAMPDDLVIASCCTACIATVLLLISGA